MRTRACLFCLLAVSVYADRTRFLHICTDQLDMSANPPSVFPCLEVDPCKSFGNYVPANLWTNVGTKTAWTNPAQTEAPYHEHIYENSIQHVRVPTGVTLWVVQFDITLYTSYGHLSNSLDLKTKKEIIGNCTDTTNTICNFFPEAQAESRIVPGGLQVFAWSLSTGYSCDYTTVAHGQRLEPPTPPNIIAECPAITGSIWVEGECAHTCQTDYITNPTLVVYVYFSQYLPTWGGTRWSDLGTHDSPVEIFIDTRHPDWRSGTIVVHQFRITCGLDATTVLPIDSALFTWSGYSWNTGGATGADITRRFCSGPRDKCTLTVNTSSIAYGKRNCTIQIEGSHYKSRSPQIPVRITSSAPGGWDPMPGTACDPECAPCVSGTYAQQGVFLTGKMSCVSCPLGKTTGLTTPTEPRTHPSSCTCNAGYGAANPDDGTRCDICASGTYAAGGTNNECLSCGSNTVSDPGSYMFEHCKCNALDGYLVFY